MVNNVHELNFDETSVKYILADLPLYNCEVKPSWTSIEQLQSISWLNFDWTTVKYILAELLLNNCKVNPSQT